MLNGERRCCAALVGVSTVTRKAPVPIRAVQGDQLRPLPKTT